MAANATKLKTARLKLPASTEDLRGLEIGTVVYLDGRIFTAREGVYEKAVEEGAGMPASFEDIGNVNFHCSPAATIRDDGSYNMGSVTATASFRFEKWLEDWFKLSGCNIIIGKGGMAPETYRNKFVPAGAVYLTTVGYGTGALLGRGVKRVVDTHWRDDLGLAQCIWVIDVENFGPFLVESDLEGNNLFERENAKVAANIGGLYEGLKPAIMKRYGETDDREEEVI